MKLGHCPVCHAALHADAFAADEASSALLSALKGMNKKQGDAVVGYITLFRPAKSKLSNKRAVTLIDEVLALTTNHRALTAALITTTEQIQTLRQSGDTRKMSHHNYLKTVIESKLPLYPVSQSSGAIERVTEQQNEQAWRDKMEMLNPGHFAKLEDK